MHTSEMTDRARGAFTIVSNIFISADSYPPTTQSNRLRQQKPLYRIRIDLSWTGLKWNSKGAAHGFVY